MLQFILGHLQHILVNDTKTIFRDGNLVNERFYTWESLLLSLTPWAMKTSYMECCLLL